MTRTIYSAADSNGAMPAQPRTLFMTSGQEQRLAFFGDWTVLTVGTMERILREFAVSEPIHFDLREITRLDTVGALVLQRMALACHKGDSACVFMVENEHCRNLLDKVAGSVHVEMVPDGKAGPCVIFLNQLGREIISEFHMVKEFLGFLGGYLVMLVSSLLRPGRLRVTSLTYHMEQTGLAAVPIVALLSFLIGAVVAYMGVTQLARFGAQIFVINLVEITILREMAVLLTSILVAGRSGSSFTAQIGAMMVNEEVAAMRSMGLAPMALLVLPRVMALTLMLPALVFLADIMGMLGGGVAVWLSMGLSPESFVARMQESINLNNFWAGLIKAPFFAVVIGLVGCFQGFRVTGSAESVGRLTTHAVVQSIFLVIVLDAVFALFFTALRF